MIQAVLIILFFLLIAILMMTRKLQTIVALPILAIGVALIAGVPFMGKIDDVEMGILQYVIEGGMVKQMSPIISVVLAAVN